MCARDLCGSWDKDCATNRGRLGARVPQASPELGDTAGERGQGGGHAG
jgi:hypothetical protein